MEYLGEIVEQISADVESVKEKMDSLNANVLIANADHL